MKNCPYCNIEIGGDLSRCPFCESRLSGEDHDAPYFPKPTALKLQSFFYKLQLFIVWMIIIGTLGADFLFGVRIYRGWDFHWSLLILMWLLAFEFGIMRLFKRGYASARILTLFAFLVAALLLVTAYFVGFFNFAVIWIVPVVLAAVMISNFVLSMIDRSGNSMVYLFLNLLIGVLPYIVLLIMKRDCPVAWKIDLLLSVILFIGAMIFRGREVISEIQRRLHF